MILKIVKNDDSVPTPDYKTPGSSGMDLYSNEDVLIPPMGRMLVGTGLKIAIPDGYEGQIRPRSGLCYKHGITVLNSPGTIDSDYRGELKVLLVNISNDSYKIKKGDRIAQLVITPYVKAEITMVKELDTTERGEGGFGSTGK